MEHLSPISIGTLKFLESTLTKVQQNKQLYLCLESTLMEKGEGSTVIVNQARSQSTGQFISQFSSR